MESRLNEPAQVIRVARAIHVATRISLRELAHDIHRYAGRISRVEREIDQASLPSLITIARRLGVSLEAVIPDGLSAATHPRGGTT